MTEPLWPAPATRKGSRIVHSWRCARTDPIVETVRRTVSGQARVCFQCVGCGGTDLAERELRRNDDPKDAA
jgi:hypothetical protein